MPLLIAPFLMPLVLGQSKEIRLNDIAGKTFAELGEILGKPVRTNKQSHMGEERQFKSPFPNCELVSFYLKEGELIPGYIQLIFKKNSSIDWGSALKIVGFSISGAKLSGVQIQGVKTTWDLHWYDRKQASSGGQSCLALGVPQTILAAATKRAAQSKIQVAEKPIELYALLAAPEDAWESAFGKKYESSEAPVEYELVNTSTGESKKAFEWMNEYGSQLGQITVWFRGATVKGGTPYKVVLSDVGDPATIWKRVALPKDHFAPVALAPRDSIPDYMERSEYMKSLDGKFVATLDIYKDSKKRPPIFYVDSTEEWQHKD